MEHFKSLHTTTTHFLVQIIGTHHFYSTSVKNAAIHYGISCTGIRQGDVTTSVHKLHKLWITHAAEIKENRGKNDNLQITEDPPLHVGDRVLIMYYNSHGLDPKFFRDRKVWKFNSDRQIVEWNPTESSAWNQLNCLFGLFWPLQQPFRSWLTEELYQAPSQNLLLKYSKTSVRTVQVNVKELN